MAERPPRTPRRCPACGADKPLRIVYGYPTPEIFDAAERGELVLGGCCIADGLPTRQCCACGATFGGLRVGRLR